MPVTETEFDIAAARTQFRRMNLRTHDAIYRNGYDPAYPPVGELSTDSEPASIKRFLRLRFTAP